MRRDRDWRSIQWKDLPRAKCKVFKRAGIRNRSMVARGTTREERSAKRGSVCSELKVEEAEMRRLP